MSASLAAWSLIVGGVDISSYLLSGTFSEIASSSASVANFTVNGAHATLLEGSAVTLKDGNSVIAWEGTVTSAIPQFDGQGNQIATLVRAAALSASFAVGIASGSYQNNDIAVLAAQIASTTDVSWGGPAAMGVVAGALTFSQADDALTTLATIGSCTWRVQNGALQFVAEQNGLVSIPVALNAVNNTVSKINILGGADATTRIPLSAQITPIGAFGPAVYVSQPEIADATTLGILANVLANRYGAGSIRAQSSFSDITLRAGDWVQDENGIVAIAYQTRYELINGVLQLTASFGFPALPVNPQYSAAFADAMHRTPVARLHSDYVVSGCTLNVNGLQATISAGAVNIGGNVYQLLAQTLNLPANETVLIIATAAGFAVAPTLAPPAPGTGVALFTVTANATAVLQQGDVRTHGGVGNSNLKPANPDNTPSISVGTIALAAEGATSAKATIPFTINGLTLDDTIGSVEVVQSFAGENQWGNPHTLEWSPGTTSFTDYRHGLSAGQAYDLGVNILGRNGVPLNTTPLLIGVSPTISAAAIAIALNLDQVDDGTTYLRMPGANMDPNRRALIDFVQGGHLGKHLGNIPDDSGSSRFAVLAVDANRRAIIDPTQAGHVGGALTDGSGKLLYGRTSPEYQSNFAPSGDMKSSQMMNGVAAPVPMVSTSGLSYVSSTGASPTGNSTISLYWDGTHGSQIPSYHPPSAAVGAFTNVNASSALVGNNFNASSTYYFCLRINIASNTLEYRLQTGGAAADQNDESWLNLDGYTPFAKNLACSTPTVNTGGGGGTSPGGGGGGNSCPAIEQIIETQRGFIPAGEIIAGDSVRDPDGRWNVVHFAENHPAQIVLVGIAGETLRVDTLHAWQRPDGTFIDTLDLKLGTLLQGVDGKLYPVERLEMAAEGVMRKLRVDRQRFVIGKVIGHNAVTL
jgi:hypothetical protein